MDGNSKSNLAEGRGLENFVPSFNQRPSYRRCADDPATSSQPSQSRSLSKGTVAVDGRRIKYAAGEPRFDALSATFPESLATYRVARKSSFRVLQFHPGKSFPSPRVHHIEVPRCYVQEIRLAFSFLLRSLFTARRRESTKDRLY